jgi:hypothetical protein
MAYSAIDTFVFRGKAPWTLKHGKPDNLATKPAKECEKIQYMKPDGKVKKGKAVLFVLSFVSPAFF